jgi:tetratricopeptide (TPR) repeat protein
MNEVVRLAPRNANAYGDRAYVLLQKQQYRLALDDLATELRLDPTRRAALINRGFAYQHLGEFKSSLANYEAAVGLNSHDAGALTRLARLLATCPDGSIRNGEQAVDLARKACELTHWKARFPLSALAAAYAETRDFNSAVNYQERALSRVDEFDPYLRKDRAELELYHQHKPYRQISPSPLQMEEVGKKSDSL